VAERCLKTLRQWDPEEVSSADDSGSEDNGMPVIISPVTPITPITPICPQMSDDSSDSSNDSVTFYMQEDAQHRRLLGTIRALHDEVARACVLNHVPVPMMWVPQLPLLDHFSDYRPHLFHKKLRVDPQIFDHILEQISSSDIFIPKGN